MNQKLTDDLKKLAKAQVVAPLTKQLNSYEKRAKELVKELDRRSREARTKSRAKFGEIVEQLKKTRGQVETRVKAFIDDETKRLNGRVTELFESLKAVAQPRAKAKSATASAKAPRKKTGSPRKTAKKAAPAATASDSHATAH